MWILLSLLAGLSDALRDAFSKKAAPHIARPLITWSYSIFALPFVLPNLVIPASEHIPTFFWFILPLTAALHICGGLALVKALQLSDLSLCTPMIAFSPVFLLAIGTLITGDVPSPFGIIGALLVTAGSYVLNLKSAKYGTLGPFRALLREPGSRIMLALALLWSITGSIDRVVVQRIDPTFWGASQISLIALLFIPVAIHQGALRQSITARSIGALCVIGGCNALSLVTYLVALKIAAVHYVICLKRSSILFSVFFGRAFFSESVSKDRLPGAILMLLGVIVIALLA
jgi:drug/metabolite transporter (DMT)-like permease